MTAPTLEQVMELPTLMETDVRPKLIDVNGNMNVCHYLELNVDGMTAVPDQVGIDDAYRAEWRVSVFAGGDHLRYYSELHQGEKLSVHPVVLSTATRRSCT